MALCRGSAAACGFAAPLAVRLWPSRRDTISHFSLDQETGIAIWENQEATPRVFPAPEARVASSVEEALDRLKDTPVLTHSVWIDRKAEARPGPEGQQATGSLQEFQLRPNEVWIKYKADAPGILTLVDSYIEGWRAEINGKEAPVLRVDGAFRGVKIEAPGEVTVRFWYRPPRWNLSLGLCCLGLIVLSFFTLRAFGITRGRSPMTSAQQSAGPNAA